MLTGRNFIALSFCVFLFLIVSVWALPNGRFVLVLTNPDRPPDYPLTVIANAPNPAGFAILKNHFPDGSISAGRLLLSALLPTLVAAGMFLLPV